MTSAALRYFHSPLLSRGGVPPTGGGAVWVGATVKSKPSNSQGGMLNVGEP
ncbi:MAG: hypothetical protein HW397_561, partial [Dehalococcoidia bacterium]|nr:hypothetical protein [Dehalococcoidia bacterium]